MLYFAMAKDFLYNPFQIMANNGSHEKAHKGRRLRWWQLIVLVIVFSIGGLGLAYIRATGTIDLAYRVGTSLKAFRAILSLSSEDVRAFVDSYEIFGMEQISPRDESKIKDYYRVVNQLCALGEVEKMYIPPVLDLPKGVYGNQLLFEKMMAESLNVGPGKKLLELGCGRGRIAHHVARLTGAKVVGLNIGDDQIQNAIDYANSTGLQKQLEFHRGSYNDPLPFADGSFDGFYHVQALTYVKDLSALLKELHRVLKPGAKLSFLDWFMLEAYEDNNPEHRELLRKTKAIIGAVYTPRPEEYHAALEKAGFDVLVSKESSLVGHQYPMIQKARDFFMPVGHAVNFLSSIGVIPSETAVLLNRLNLYVDDFIESDRRGLFTTSYWIVAQKRPDTVIHSEEQAHSGAAGARDTAPDGAKTEL